MLSLIGIVKGYFVYDDINSYYLLEYEDFKSLWVFDDFYIFIFILVNNLVEILKKFVYRLILII